MTHHTFIRGLLEHLYNIGITKLEILAVLNQSYCHKRLGLWK